MASLSDFFNQQEKLQVKQKLENCRFALYTYRWDCFIYGKKSLYPI